MIDDEVTVRWVFTVFTISRGFHLPVKLDLETIQYESKIDINDQITKSELDFACRVLGIQEEYVEWWRFHMSSKRGPNGQSIISSIHDYTLLPKWLKDNIISLAGIGLQQCFELLDTVNVQGSLIIDLWNKAFPRKTKLLRRISAIPDKEGKTRTIGIFDYWSQSALKPLHDVLMNKLSRIPIDCTYNQNNFLNFSLNKPYYMSFDLTAATDLMPIKLQKKIIDKIIGEERSKAWFDIMCKEGFSSKGHHELIFYKTGQPMGGYSSWPIMALTHHVIVQIASLRANRKGTREYVLLGDDIVIFNKKVGEEYQKLISSLDMKISDTKTHMSSTTFEFCKRWFHNGKEITGFSLPGLWEVRRSYSLLQNFLMTQSDRGWILIDSEANPPIISLYTTLGLPSQGKRVQKLYEVFSSLAIAKRTGKFEGFVKQIQQTFGLPALAISEETATSIFSDVKETQLMNDMNTVQTESYEYELHMSQLMMKQHSAWAERPKQVYLSERIPIVIAANDIIEELTEKLMILTGDRESPEFKEILFFESLGKFKISRHTYGLTEEKVVNRDLSRLTKPLINAVKEHIYSLAVPLIINEDPPVS